MTTLRAGIIGCGGRGYAHALGYQQSESVEIAACADTHAPAAQRLARGFDVPRIYASYHEMLANEDLDVVSMALWPALHCEAVLACVNAPRPPRLVNAEKPMAPTFAEAVHMHEACRVAGIQLTFSHQRRFGPSFATAQALLKDGCIGELRHMMWHCSNLFDWGTHWFDMMFFYNDDLPVDWVMGQIDCAEDRRVFGVPVDTSGLAHVHWRNGVTGQLTTGPASPGPNRLLGTRGIIEIRHDGVRLLREGHKWRDVELEPGSVPGGDTSRHIMDSIDCLRSGRTSILCSDHALQTTELIFAAYESSRRREKVFLPLSVEDSPLLSMLENGDITIPDWPAFLTEAEDTEGFELLFDGASLAGWKRGGGDSWQVSGGLLCSWGHDTAWLRSADAFTDFVLCFEYRLSSRGDSGVCLRTGDGRGTPPGGIEVRLRDDRGDPLSVRSTGAITDAVPPSTNSARGGIGWNEIELSCLGSRVEVVLNRETLLTCETSTVPALADWPASGFLGLRCHSGTIDVRSLRLKPLVAEV